MRRHNTARQRKRLIRLVGPADARCLAVDAAFGSGNVAFALELLHRVLAEAELERMGHRLTPGGILISLTEERP